jgi:hypothetical protein
MTCLRKLPEERHPSMAHLVAAFAPHAPSDVQPIAARLAARVLGTAPTVVTPSGPGNDPHARAQHAPLGNTDAPQLVPAAPMAAARRAGGPRTMVVVAALAGVFSAFAIVGALMWTLRADGRDRSSGAAPLPSVAVPSPASSDACAVCTKDDVLVCVQHVVDLEAMGGGLYDPILAAGRQVDPEVSMVMLFVSDWRSRSIHPAEVLATATLRVQRQDGGQRWLVARVSESCTAVASDPESIPGDHAVPPPACPLDKARIAAVRHVGGTANSPLDGIYTHFHGGPAWQFTVASRSVYVGDGCLARDTP